MERRASEEIGGPETEMRSQEIIPVGFDPQVLTTALQDISALNEILLERLVSHAQRSLPEFPLDNSLSARIADLSATDRCAIAQCGVLLADAEYTNLSFWQTVQHMRYDTDLIRTPASWLDRNDAVSYATAVLLGSLYVLRTAPNLAQLLLGMSSPVATIYVQLSLRSLVLTAQACPQLVKPRWSQQLGTWSKILDFGQEDPPRDASKLNTYIFKLSAAQLSTVARYFHTHPAEGAP